MASAAVEIRQAVEAKRQVITALIQQLQQLTTKLP